MMRTLAELIDHNDSAWPIVQEWIADASIPVEVIPSPLEAGEAALLATQVTTRSPMGAIVYHTAGIFVDHGWLRILGAGNHPRLRRSLPGWNEGKSFGFYLIADDAIGGFFALNGGNLGNDPGNIYYFAPDSLRWEPCKMGYSQFLIWWMSGSLKLFYKSRRWKNWQDDVKKLGGDLVFGIYPFLWAKGPPIGKRHRGMISVSEQWSLQFEMQRQLDGVNPSESDEHEKDLSRAVP